MVMQTGFPCVSTQAGTNLLQNRKFPVTVLTPVAIVLCSLFACFTPLRVHCILSYRDVTSHLSACTACFPTETSPPDFRYAVRKLNALLANEDIQGAIHSGGTRFSP